jgi:hypothetical protein
MIKDVMTFLPKPERNSIWVFAHDAPGQPRQHGPEGGASHHAQTSPRLPPAKRRQSELPYCIKGTALSPYYRLPQWPRLRGEKGDKGSMLAGPDSFRRRLLFPRLGPLI